MQCIEVFYETEISINKNKVNKVIIFKDKQFSVLIRGAEVNLNKLNISDQYTCSKNGIYNVCIAVKAIPMCEGLEMEKRKLEFKANYTIECLQNDNSTKQIIRSKFCKSVLPFTFLKQQTCTSCTRQRLSYIQPVIEKTEEEQIRELMPSATEAMITLIMSQVSNSKHSNATQNRWERSIVNECMNWYTRSPLSYIQLRQSGLLLLPSPSMLILYKNSIAHSPGLSRDIFCWMDQEANRMNMPDSGRTGGILLDEMSIQQKIELSKHGTSIEMVGFVDMGSESENLSAIRAGKKSKKMGSHILQFMFQGISGFRFPFAHFVSDQVNAGDLYIHVWDSVNKLSQFGFETLYISMDGAVSNRSFMKLHFPEGTIIEKRFKAPMPCNFTKEMIFFMDPSHTFKKIRNNIMKSGNHNKSTRLLKLADGKEVQWTMWVDAYKFDRTNPVQIHRKLTNEHIFPNQSEKMRNKLAEEVLNADMLTLMESYQQRMGANASALDGAIELLKNTSVLIDVFRDRRTVNESNDIRLQKLHSVQQWFLNWEKKVQSQKSLMSSQCHEDIQSSIIGFLEICDFMIKKHPGTSIIPAMINSDAIENNFCQHRGKFNGLNTNPTALQYRRNINGVILGQSAVSKKSNAKAVRRMTENFAFSSNKPVRGKSLKRKSETTTTKPIKCLKM